LNKKKINVEFFGVAGVGKTTYCKKVIDEFEGVKGTEIKSFLKLNKPGLKKYIYKLFIIAKLLFKDINLILNTVRLIIKSKQISNKDFVINLYNLLYIASIHNSNYNKMISFLDQGLFQALVSMKLSSCRNINDEMISYVNQFINKETIVVVVKAPKEIIFDRLENRKEKYSRLEKSQSNFSFSTAVKAFEEVKLNILDGCDNNLIKVVEINSITKGDIIRNKLKIEREILNVVK